jgi:hypothetical protein
MRFGYGNNYTMISDTMILNMDKFSYWLINELKFENFPQIFINLWSNGHM